MSTDREAWARAVRNAIEAERGAARFYRRWLAEVHDDRVAALLMQLVAMEEAHASSIEQRARALALDLRPDVGDRAVPFETAPEWAWIEEADFATVLRLAVDAERQAFHYYQAVSELFSGVSRSFFASLAEQEAGHAELLLERLSPRAAPP